MKSLYRQIAAIVSMCVGAVGVLGLLYYMNELLQPPQPEAKKSVQDFTVEKQEEKPPPRRVEPKPRPKPRTTTAQRAPMPNISTQLSGLGFDLPQLEQQDILGADQLLGGSDADKRLVMTGDSVDKLPRPTMRKSPAYPNNARQRGIQGHVVLKLMVTERGDVERVKVVEAEPAGVFEDVAIAAVREWRFEPGMYKGTPVPTEVQQRIPFRLN